MSLTGQRCDICVFSGFGFDYIFSFVEGVSYLIPVLWYYAREMVSYLIPVLWYNARERGFVFGSCIVVYCS